MLPVHWGCFIDEIEVAHSSQSSGSSPLLYCYANRVDVADVWAWPPLTVNGVHGSNGEEDEMPSPPCTILNVDSRWLLQFLLHGISGEVLNYLPCSLGL
jgi:hypothetical protein